MIRYLFALFLLIVNTGCNCSTSGQFGKDRSDGMTSNTALALALKELEKCGVTLYPEFNLRAYREDKGYTLWIERLPASPDQFIVVRVEPEGVSISPIPVPAEGTAEY